MNEEKYPKKKKSVQFIDQPLVFIMNDWISDSEAARKGTWHLYAIDRKRFEFRIEMLEFLISPILTKEHREVILKSKFHCYNVNDDNQNV